MPKRLYILIIAIAVLGLTSLAGASSAQDDTSNQLERLLAGIKGSENADGLNIRLNEILDLYKRRYTAESPEYADCLMWCAYWCAEYGDNNQASDLLKKSKDIFKKYGNGTFAGRDTVNEIFRLDLESKLEYNSERDFMAVRKSRRSCELKRKYFGNQSETYLNALLDLSRLYAERLEYGKSNLYHNLGYDAYVGRIKNEFCQSSESERVLYWEKAIKYIDRTLDLAHKAGGKSRHGGDRSLASAAYNAMLLSKGLLLNTSVNFENHILSSGNAEAIISWQKRKRVADERASQSVIDSLDRAIIESLERSGQGFDLPHLSIGWKDVAAKLTDNDLAIEFYKTRKGDYGAILLKRNWSSPRIVRLPGFVAKGRKYLPLATAIDKVSLEDYTSDMQQDMWNLSKSIWTDDIVRYFPQNGNGNIYFSADGELQITGIEYLPFVRPTDNKSYYCVSDLFNIYRVSSTRQLVMAEEKSQGAEASVYGGLTYGMEPAEMLADARKYESVNRFDLAYSPSSRHRALRVADQSIPILEGTKTEADSIISIINRHPAHRLAAHPFTGSDGTEASFKSLSGRKQSLLHIATHGYFYDEADPEFEILGLENNPMTRSGLLMAGADYKWQGYDVPEGVDDGFLTSLEISNLDLRGLELAVLSACETGKGNIEGDGVFGLQRGFKMASAKSILMSLWKVNDDATCLLMTEFYKNWIGDGKNKREALRLAQDSVRSHKEKGWDAPKYWAAFILLDGLDE